MNSTKICSVNGDGIVLYSIEGWIPDVVPKVKHDPRVLHPDYLIHLKKFLENKVKKRKQEIEQEKLMEKILVEQKRKDIEVFKINIDKWFQGAYKK